MPVILKESWISEYSINKEMQRPTTQKKSEGTSSAFIEIVCQTSHLKLNVIVKYLRST